MSCASSVTNVKIHGKWQDNLPGSDVSLIIADPVYLTQSVNDVVRLIHTSRRPGIVFMDTFDLLTLAHRPNQICHWVKPISTKNTCKSYSRFVEAICFYGTSFHGELHWANRTGIFTDVLMSNVDHPWKKPESLIERLIRNHYSGRGVIYDPCAGSFTVDAVCRKLGIPSVSVECEGRYHNPPTDVAESPVI